MLSGKTARHLGIAIRLYAGLCAVLVANTAHDRKDRSGDRGGRRRPVLDQISGRDSAEPHSGQGEEYRGDEGGVRGRWCGGGR